MVASVQREENKAYEGKRMDEVARVMNKEPVDALSTLLISEPVFPYAIYFTMSDTDVRAAMKQPGLALVLTARR
jgi:hypothetical protein